MPGIPMGMIIELAVALLLATTIGYCIVLNRKLNRLHTDREELQKMIRDLVEATTMANGAIKGLKQSAIEADELLNQRLNDAERFGIELANHVNAGHAVMERIAKITEAVRSHNGAVPEVRRARGALETLTEHQRRRESAA